MFESSVRSAGDLGAFFEHDRETGYFYLCDKTREAGKMIGDSIQVFVGLPDFKQEHIAVSWDPTETKVGLFIREILWAVFDTESGAKYGGNYRPGHRADIPSRVIDCFQERVNGVGPE